MIVQGTSVGLDVHARSVVAHAIDEDTGQVIRETLVPDAATIVSWLQGPAPPVRVAYEAGPTGFGLARAITAAGMECVVAAPSKLQRPAGDRVKTDARDAAHLAKLLRLGEVVAVSVPEVGTEAARDLVRAREDARSDLMRARHRLSKLLLRQGIVYSGGKPWTGVHQRWLQRQRFELPLLQAAFDNDLDAVLSVTARRDRLDELIEQTAATDPWRAVVTRLSCLRGVSTLTAFALAVEIGDWSRFSGATIGSYAGLVPSEYSTGGTRSQGSITKAGNAHVRRLLVEAAWQHRRPYATPGQTMRRRWEAATPAARARGHAGNRRLHKRWQQFDRRSKHPCVANTAIARELAGWCWSLAVLDD